MGYTVVALKEKLMEMYPEIEKNGILVGLVFSSPGEELYQRTVSQSCGRMETGRTAET